MKVTENQKGPIASPPPDFLSGGDSPPAQTEEYDPELEAIFAELEDVIPPAEECAPAPPASAGESAPAPPDADRSFDQELIDILGEDDDFKPVPGGIALMTASPCEPCNIPDLSKITGCTIPPQLPPRDTKLPGTSRLFDMSDYCMQTVEMYKELSGRKTLKYASTPFCPEGSLPAADEEVKGQLAGSACSVLMKSLWLARLARPDSAKPIGDLATHIQKWSVNDDRRVYRLVCYLNSTSHYAMYGHIHDKQEDLKLLLFVDANLAGEVEHTKAISGALLVLAGPNSWFPIAWVSRRQTSTSRSTTEAEVVSLAAGLFGEALPFLDLFETIFQRKVELIILEDNSAVIIVLKKGYSSKLRHVSRTHKINLGSIKEVVDDEGIQIIHCPTNLQSADIFTKALPPMKWDAALELLGISTTALLELRASDPSIAVEAASTPAPPLEEEPALKGASAAKQPDPLVPLDQTCAAASSIPRSVQAAAFIADDVIDDIARTSEVLSAENNDCLIQKCADVIKAAAAMSKPPRSRPSGKLPGWGTLIEVCTRENSTLGEIAHTSGHYKVIRVSENDQFGSSACLKKLKHVVISNPGISVHGSLPCTVWSSWQKMCEHKLGTEYSRSLSKRRKKAVRMLRDFIELAELALSRGGHISFEWPRYCSGWLRRELQTFITRNDLLVADVDGCACGLTNAAGEPVLKQWRFITSSERCAQSLRVLRCTHAADFRHAEISGSVTKSTGYYTPKLCRTILTSLFGYGQEVPGMSCVPCGAEFHVDHDPPVTGFGATPMQTPVGVVFDVEECAVAPPVLAAVTKLLSRAESRAPEAIQAIQAEGKALVDAGTWLENTVIERETLIHNAKIKGEKIHLGELLSICSIKHFEKHKSLHKHKGRICFRGDIVKDEQGAAATFQELHANPIAVQQANANIAYGCIPGNSSSMADAIRAYIQSLLKSLYPTWVLVPKELWPPHWHGKYKRPMCLLERALYGHPESGAHWEQHLTEAVKAIGGVPVTNHHSSFYFKEERLLLSVYVDDLLLAGPTEHHEGLWARLKEKIDIEDPEPLDRFLGREHRLY